MKTPIPWPAKVPFVQSLGTEMVACGDGLCELQLALVDQHMNGREVAHGGVVMTLLDVAMAHAARSIHRRELPEGAEVLQKVGTYKPTDLESEEFDEVRDELYYLLGRFYYQKGDLGQSIALLGQVPDNSDYYIPAQFFLGVAETREFHGPQAVEAFKNVLRKNISLREAAAKSLMKSAAAAGRSGARA